MRNKYLFSFLLMALSVMGSVFVVSARHHYHRESKKSQKEKAKEEVKEQVQVVQKEEKLDISKESLDQDPSSIIEEKKDKSSATFKPAVTAPAVKETEKKEPVKQVSKEIINETPATKAKEEKAVVEKPVIPTKIEPKKDAVSETKETPKEENKLDISKVIFGHVTDSHEWHLFSWGNTEIVIPLPIIIFSPEKGLSVFLSSAFDEGKTYDGYRLDHGKIKETIVSEDGESIYDISITKNILSMFISLALLIWITMSTAKKYNTNGAMQAPKGMQNALEIIIIFIRDEVAKPYLGDKYPRYFPLLITMFFFIWINNLLGLLPVGFNLTGNIAVTCCLALISFIVLIANSNKQFWLHLINPPGAPLGVKFILVPIEIISLFIKPLALMIRLFANIIAGHIMIIAVISMIFIFGALNVFAGIGFIPVSLAFSIFMFLLELLVGALQAFIFVNLSAVFIGQAIEEHHDAHDAKGGHGVKTAHH